MKKAIICIIVCGLLVLFGPITIIFSNIPYIDGYPGFIVAVVLQLIAMTVIATIIVFQEIDSLKKEIKELKIQINPELKEQLEAEELEKEKRAKGLDLFGEKAEKAETL